VAPHHWEIGAMSQNKELEVYVFFNSKNKNKLRGTVVIFLRGHIPTVLTITYTWSDNKVCELATVRLPWQHWTKALV